MRVQLKRRRRPVHVALWIGQGLLGAVFTVAGGMKLFGAIPRLQAQFGLPGVIGAPMTRAIGAVELAGGLGMVLPAGTRVMPGLTPLAAGGLAAVMAGASGFHLGRQERSQIVPPLVLGALALVVAWGRGRLRPIQARR